MSNSSVASAPQQNTSYETIPIELRAYRQFVAWRLAERGGEKPTKLPINPHTGKLASVIDGSTWGVFEEAVAAVTKWNCNGIGFVLTKSDPYVFVDLDDPQGDEVAFQRQRKIEAEFNSYSEVSPSGRGLHIIVKGNLPGKGKRRGNIELYDNERYVTLTGNVYRSVPIAERQEPVELLWAELGGSTEPQRQSAIADNPETRSDDEIINQATNATNGPRFRNLWAGNWQGLYRSPSEADLALVNMIAFYTRSRQQIERLFLRSELGQRKKAQRRNYLANMIEKSFDRQLPPIETSALTVKGKPLNDFSKTQPQMSLQSNVFDFAAFTADWEPPCYVWHHILQQGSLYAHTALWGGGKTSVALTIALHVALGRPLADHRTKASRVLYCAGENPDDVRLRVLAGCAVFGVDASELDTRIYFTRRPFSIDDPAALKAFTEDAARFGPFGLCIIDTGPAHSKAEDENDNRAMHALAMALRGLMEALGNPATLALMHPAKGATRDNMGPRGGGAFSGSIDGEFFCWNESGIVEFGHRTKFRGPGFKPILFELRRHEFTDIIDNFGEPAVSIVAVPTEAQPQRKTRLTGANRIALDALADCRSVAIPPSQLVLESIPTCNGERLFPPFCVVPEAVWRQRCYANSISAGEQSAKSKAFVRSREALIDLGLVKTHADHYWIAEWCSSNFNAKNDSAAAGQLPTCLKKGS